MKNKYELKIEMDDTTDSIEVLKEKVKQLVIENGMASTFKSQREVNEYLIEHCENWIKVLEDKKQYLSLRSDKGETAERSLYEDLTSSPSLRRCTPNSVLKS